MTRPRVLKKNPTGKVPGSTLSQPRVDPQVSNRKRPTGTSPGSTPGTPGSTLGSSSHIPGPTHDSYQGRPPDRLSLDPAQGRPRILRVDPQGVYFLCKFLFAISAFFLGCRHLFKSSNLIVILSQGHLAASEQSSQVYKDILGKRDALRRRTSTANGLFHVPSSSHRRERRVFQENHLQRQGSASTSRRSLLKLPPFFLHPYLANQIPRKKKSE